MWATPPLVGDYLVIDALGNVGGGQSEICQRVAITCWYPAIWSAAACVTASSGTLIPRLDRTIAA
jgi:hypothetical protein